MRKSGPVLVSKFLPDYTVTLYNSPMVSSGCVARIVSTLDDVGAGFDEQNAFRAK
jgi:hypothetical protein